MAKTPERVKILFVTRTYPPSVGGLQHASFELHSALAKQYPTKLIKWGGSKKLFYFIYPWLLARTIIACWLDQADVVYLQDGVLAPTAAFIKLLTNKPVAMNMHGLDITYQMPLYLWLMRHSVKHVDQIITASPWSKDEIEKRYPGIPVTIIKHGIRDEFYTASAKRNDHPTLLTTGRLVERKGVAWFVDAVLPALVAKVPNLEYVVIGAGPQQTAIEKAITTHHLEKHVKLLGQISSQDRNRWYNRADLFIMANIPVAGDAEGFGLVAQEAASCGTPVMGASLEGVQSAVVEGKTGHLLKPKDAPKWIKAVTEELQKPTLERAEVRSYVLLHCLWTDIAAQYGRVLSSLTAKI